MKKILLCLLIFFTMITPALAVTWLQIDVNYLIDKDSIELYTNDLGTIEENKSVFWLKDNKAENYKDIESRYKKPVSYALSQIIVDYSKNMVALKTNVIYDKNNEIITKNTFKDSELKWDLITPNSNAELWSKLIKNPKILKKIYKYQQIKPRKQINNEATAPVQNDK